MQKDDRDLNAIETEEQSQVATDEEPTAKQVQAEAETDSATQSEDTIDTAEKDEQASGQGILFDYANAPLRGGQRFVEWLKTASKRYFIDAFSGMAQGLFCTLIAGTILAQIASWCGDNGFAHFLAYLAKIAKRLWARASA